MKKEELLSTLRFSRKKHGKDHPKTIRAIYNLVKFFPYYDGYEEKWLEKNSYKM